jgi:alcohol dehydrogenase class IV
MDALTHAVEALLSTNAFVHTDREALVATQIITQNLPKAFEEGRYLGARQNMALASKPSRRTVGVNDTQGLA